MKGFLLGILQKLALAFEAVDWTALGVSLLKVGGVPGWVLSLLLKYFGRKLETKVDQSIDDAVNTAVSDNEIEQKEAESVKEISSAQSDDDLDSAYRDSLRK